MSSVSPTSTSTAATTAANTAATTAATTSAASTSSSGGATAGQTILTALNSGAGFNVDAVVSAIVTSEGAGQTAQFNQQITQVDAQVSAYSQFTAAAATVQTAIKALATPSAFNSYQALVGDSTIATATTSSSAIPANYSLGVTQLALGTTLTSAPIAAGSGVAVGTGTLTLSVGSTSFSVAIGSTNNTLGDIANAINNATGNPGIGASVVTTNTGSYLKLSSSVTGAANNLSVTTTGGDGGLSSLTYTPGGTSNGLTQTQQAQDAIITIDGLPYNSASNSISNAISGVTINALAVSKTGVTTSLTVAPDPTGPTSAINSFVTAYNSLVGIVNNLTSYDAATSTAGPLLGDSLLGTFTSQVQGIIGGGTPGASGSSALTSLAQIGLTVNTDGTLAVNSATLNSALQTNPSAVSNLFTNTSSGVAVQLDNVLTKFTASGGLVDQTTTSLQSTLTSISTQQTALNDQLTQLQSQLYAEYTAMETVVSQLKSTASALTSELASLPQNWGPISTSTSG